MQRHLGQLSVGASAKIDTIEGEGVYAKKLGLLGFTPGVRVSVLRVAPLGDPIEVSLRGYSLALRRSEAKVVRLESGLD